MAKNQTATDAARQEEPLLMCEIITNGILISGAHHAAGKHLPLPKSKADALAAFTPPAVKIIGIV